MIGLVSDGYGIEIDHVTEPEQCLFKYRTRVDVRSRLGIENFEDHAALVDDQTRVPGLYAARFEPDRIALRRTYAGHAVIDVHIRMFPIGKAQSHRRTDSEGAGTLAG